MRFRKKPVEIEALPFLNDASSYDLLHWANSHQARAKKPFLRWHNDKLHVPTLEGEITASPGDWIIRGVAGEFYPCKPDIFRATYDEVSA